MTEFNCAVLQEQFRVTAGIRRRHNHRRLQRSCYRACGTTSSEALFRCLPIAPPQIMVLSLYQLMVKYHLHNTLLGLILVYSATELPLAIYLLRAFYGQIPGELEDAALLDGCNDIALFWRVMFPIARPAVATVLVLDLIRFWNEYLYASVLVTKRTVRTIPLATMFLLGENYADLGMLAAGLVISSLPIIILSPFFPRTSSPA
jgi:multiple sugar transport system permease protein/raffinose/stachyose/melibiose transport system permease protein